MGVVFRLELQTFQYTPKEGKKNRADKLSRKQGKTKYSGQGPKWAEHYHLRTSKQNNFQKFNIDLALIYCVLQLLRFFNF